MRKAGIGLLIGAAMMFAALPMGIGHASGFAIDFEAPTYTTGVIDGQDGWSSTGAAGSGCATYDHEVTSNVGKAYDDNIDTDEFDDTLGIGEQSLRLSNAVTSGCFGDQTFSKSFANEAGESSAENGGLSGGIRRNHFESLWTFASTVPGAEQAGLSVVASPDRGDGARMSWVQMTDTADGLAVNFYDYQSGAVEEGCVDGTNFILSNVASGLDRTVAHTIAIAMDFVEGPKNDVVTVTVDGTFTHTGTSWEDYFRECEENPSRTVDSILFRTGGTAAPATAGNGFVVDGLNIGTFNNNPTTLVVTPVIASVNPPAVYITTVNATLTDAAGPVAGKTITFKVQDTVICTADTDANGVASCDATAALPSQVLNPYQADFAGDDEYAAAHANATLVTL